MVWVVLKVAEMIEDVLGCGVLLYRQGILLSLSLLPTEPQDTGKG